MTVVILWLCDTVSLIRGGHWVYLRRLHSKGLIVVDVDINNSWVVLVFLWKASLWKILPRLPNHTPAPLAHHHLVSTPHVTSPTIGTSPLKSITTFKNQNAFKTMYISIIWISFISFSSLNVLSSIWARSSYTHKEGINLTSTTAAFDSVPMRSGPAKGRNQSEKKKIRKAHPDTINHSRRRDCTDNTRRAVRRLLIKRYSLEKRTCTKIIA